MSETLVVNEIYLSLQGESTFAGMPCVFVRLTGCDLRCSFCDTAYAFREGKKMSLPEVCARVHELAKPFEGNLHDSEIALCGHDQGGANLPVCPTAVMEGALPRRWPLVELTGGEPLLQKNSIPLMKVLCDDGFTVLLETSGAHDISPVDPRVYRIVDLKCPSSGEVERNRWENLPHLKLGDELKFVIATEEDYAWAKEQVSRHRLCSACPLLFSWASPLTLEQEDKSLKRMPSDQKPISRRELAERIIGEALPVRFQVQMHKLIWPPGARGV